MSSAREERIDRAFGWWQELIGDRGARARLRRAPQIDAVMLEEETVRLHRLLWGDGAQGTSASAYVRTALVAGALATVRENQPGRGFAKALGGQREGSDDAPLMSPIRAMALRRARTPHDALAPFRRAVALLGEKADVRDLACYLIDWCDERSFHGSRSIADEARIRFAFAYHGAADAAPGGDDKTGPEETTP